MKYAFKVTDSFATDVVSVSTGKIPPPPPGKGMGAELSVHNEKASSEILSGTAKYCVVTLTMAGQPPDEAFIEDYIQKFLDKSMDSHFYMSLPREKTDFDIAEGSRYIVVFLFDADQQPIGYLANTNPISVAAGSQTETTEFTFYQIAISEKSAEVAASIPDLPASPSAVPAPITVQTPTAVPSPYASPLSVASTEDAMTTKSITTGQAATAAAAVVVAVLGGSVGFFAVNAADYKEVLKLAALAAVPGDAAASGKSAVERLKYPFIYLRLRKYSFLLGIKDEDSSEKLLQKVKLPLKSGGKVVMDLGEATDSGTYKDLKIRHPKKAMNRKKDVTIAYTENNAILEQDHFDSKDDFSNIKYIEK